MHSAIILSALAGLAAVNAQGVTGKLGDAEVVLSNPSSPTYAATLPDLDTTTIRGSVRAVGADGGKGVKYTVHLTGLPPAELGPFLYHVHDQPVPADGNCTGTLAHLDPYVRGEDPPCDASQPQTCQVGDLSGKFGKITGATFDASYTDLYSATIEGLGSFIGNRSVVVHYPNKTRITCASFSSSGATNVTTVTGGSNSTSPSSPNSVPFTGAGAVTVASMSALVGGLVAALFL